MSYQGVLAEAVGLAQVHEQDREDLEGRRERLLGLGCRSEELREQLLLERAGPPLRVGLARDRCLDALAQGPAVGAKDDDVGFKLILASLPRAQFDHGRPPALALFAESRESRGLAGVHIRSEFANNNADLRRKASADKGLRNLRSYRFQQ